jgi:ferredoxin
VEGALQIVNGKARIVKDTYCDGLGACLGECPQGAITITEREAEPFSENEVHEHLMKTASAGQPLTAQTGAVAQKPQWPVKLNLVPVKAPFFENANLLFTDRTKKLPQFDGWKTGYYRVPKI